MGCLSNAACGHRKTPEPWLWDTVIKHRHPGALTGAHCKPQSTALLPADLLWGKSLGSKEFILFCTSRASRGQAGGADAAGAFPPFPGAEGTVQGPAWGTALPGRWIQGENPQPFHRPARQAANCWVAPIDPASSHLKQQFSGLLKCFTSVVLCEFQIGFS